MEDLLNVHQQFTENFPELFNIIVCLYVSDSENVCVSVHAHTHICPLRMSECVYASRYKRIMGKKFLNQNVQLFSALVNIFSLKLKLEDSDLGSTGISVRNDFQLKI